MDNTPLRQRLSQMADKQRSFGRHVLANTLEEAAFALRDDEAVRNRVHSMLMRDDASGWNAHLYFILYGDTHGRRDDQSATG